jgi:hypothetical protein
MSNSRIGLIFTVQGLCELKLSKLWLTEYYQNEKKGKNAVANHNVKILFRNILFDCLFSGDNRPQRTSSFRRWLTIIPLQNIL